MMYCFREREQLLNINEMLAGFRMFPSYLRIGGLREDLPSGFHEAVKKWLDAFPGQAERVRGSPHEEPDLDEAHEGRRRHDEGRCDDVRAASDRWRARPASPTTSAGRFRISATRPTTSTCRRRTAGDVYARYLVRIDEMRQSTRIAQQALARITPRGVFDIQDYRIVPPPKDKVYSEMEALIQHFLIYSQGFNVPAGEAYVPIEGPRGEHGFSIVSDGTNRPYRIKLRAPSFYACQGLPKLIIGGMIADVIAVIGSTDVVMGDVDR